MKSRYKILSLDGGGTWAVIQAMALQNIYSSKYGEDVTGHQILGEFDLVAANSGGSLVLAGMAANWKMSQLVATVSKIENRKKLFTEKPFLGKNANLFFKILHFLGIGVGPKWITSKKIDGLNDIFNKLVGKQMCDLPEIVGGKKPHFLISAFDYNQNRAVFFRSNTDSLAQTFKIQEKLKQPQTSQKFKSINFLDAVHASSNAPVNYFDKPAIISYVDGEKLYAWDGAVGGYNNPILAAVIEALANGVAKEKIDVLSIGTGSVFLPISNNYKQQKPKILTKRKKINKCFFKDLQKLSESILADPPDAATYMAYIILHGTKSINPCTCTEKFVRLNPMVQPIYDSENSIYILPQGFINMANKNKNPYCLFKKLSKLDMDVVKEKDFKLVKDFCEEWLKDNIVNQSIRSDENLEPVMGYGWFSAGKDVWSRNNIS